MFAVPGNPLDPRAGGTNQLIKDGARLVTEVADIIEGLGMSLGGVVRHVRDHVAEPQQTTPLVSVLQTDRERVTEALGPAPIGLDDLVRMTRLDPSQVRVVLLELDLAGRIERSAGQRIALKS